MEITLKNVSYRYKNKKLLDHISFQIEDNQITGITGEYKSLISEMIEGIVTPSSGTISIGELPVNKLTTKTVRKEVCLIYQNYRKQFFTSTVKEEMLFLVSRLGYQRSNLNKKMEQSLMMVGLDKTYMNKNIHELSSGEQKLIQIAVGLMSNPSIIIFDEVFSELDYYHQKNLIRLIRMLKDKYNKTIIITSNDCNLLYELTDYMIVLKKGKVIADSKTIKLYQDINFLIKEEIEIPDLVKFTELAKEKKVKLSYHRDILDLIKDVYKHV